MVDGLAHVESRTLREWSSVYLGIAPTTLSVLGVEVGDYLEVSAAPDRIAIRPWD